MKSKSLKCIIICLCIFLVFSIGAFALLCGSGFIVFDNSAIVYAEILTWNEKNYVPTGGEYTEGRTIAKSKDGWNINEAEEDPSHTFIVARSFIDQYLYVADDYTIPTSGEITKICWADEYIEDKEFLKALSEIDAVKTVSFDYETEALFMLTDTQRMKPIYFAYENCPIATEYKGYLGKINGKWAITAERKDGESSPNPNAVSCYAIPDEYSEILEKYFFE